MRVAMHLRTVQQVAVPLLIAVLTAAHAHVQPTRRLQGHGPKHGHAGGQNCSCVPGSRPAESYHIHVMFYPMDAPNVNPDDPAGNNPNNAENAAALRTAFMEHFNIAECPDEGPPGRPHEDPSELCAFAVDPTTGGQPFPAAQPFVTPEFAFFVPLDRWADAVPWMMLNRGVFDVLVHPNTCGWSCAPQDHLLNSIWMGKPWPVKFRLPTEQSGQPSPSPHVPHEELGPGIHASAATSDCISLMESTRELVLIALVLSGMMTLLGLVVVGPRICRRYEKDGTREGLALATEGYSSAVR